MKLREKLEAIKSAEARNLEREQAHMAKLEAEVAVIHKSVERYAAATLRSIGTLAEYHNVERGELLELFIDTLQALEQCQRQED